MVEYSDIEKQMEQANIELRSCAECFHNIICCSADGIIIVDRDDIVRFANPAVEKFFHRSAEELLGNPVGFSLKVGEKQELTITMSNNEMRTVEMWTVETEWGGKQARLATLRDITEHKRVEEELREKTEQLEELNRTLAEKVRDEVNKNRDKDHLLILQSRQAAMGEMIGNIAHQWRQPLTAISLLIQDLGECYVYGDFSKEYLDTTIRNALNVIQHMSQTIDDFRNFFKREKEKQAFSVRQIVDRSLSFIESSLRFNTISVAVDMEDDLLAFGFANEFSQVLINIISNAKDAFREKGTSEPRIRIKGFRQDKKTVVTITDNAGGIPDDIIDMIFDPYFTTRKLENGTGLGLYMSKTIIEKNMGGKLTATNVDGGACFRIEI
ncbi:MAG TPA: ATP-binding protein [Geobacteraceae bacterium]|nr:ATP-binding protein [Geobacteraceae bacterium]